MTGHHSELTQVAYKMCLAATQNQKQENRKAYAQTIPPLKVTSYLMAALVGSEDNQQRHHNDYSTSFQTNQMINTVCDNAIYCYTVIN